VKGKGSGRVKISHQMGENRERRKWIIPNQMGNNIILSQWKKKDNTTTYHEIQYLAPLHTLLRK
jgi:predicted carbohydrate-binding protein with CBM5 and CBM33 domain